ncbi:MAG: phosphate ABC transporter substrate-binding protein PstS [Ignavibacteriota bacterium]
MNRKLLSCGVLLLAGASIAAAQKITACGASFPEAIYQKWFSLYHTANKGVEINYTANGSGGGVKGVTDGTVDFGASDSPMSDTELSAAKGKILHFPTVLGAVVLTYNIPGVTQELKFTGATISGIYLGKITKWNDKALAADNPGVKLPAEDIVVIHRTDSSGTTFIFTDYLSKVSPDWKSKVGAAKAVSWPASPLGGAQSSGVTGLLKQTPYSIGYVELLWALQNKLSYGLVQNSSGQWIKASMDSVSAAAAGVAMPDDFRVSITNASGKTAYPISSFTWMLIPAQIQDAGKAKAVKEFLGWMLTKGQDVAPSLFFAPPAEGGVG